MSRCGLPVTQAKNKQSPLGEEKGREGGIEQSECFLFCWFFG